MFQKIQELIDDKDALVFVLIDEVLSFFFYIFFNTAFKNFIYGSHDNVCLSGGESHSCTERCSGRNRTVWCHTGCEFCPDSARPDQTVRFNSLHHEIWMDFRYTTLLCTIHCCKSSQINNGLMHLIPNLWPSKPFTLGVLGSFIFSLIFIQTSCFSDSGTQMWWFSPHRM